MKLSSKRIKRKHSKNNIQKHSKKHSKKRVIYKTKTRRRRQKKRSMKNDSGMLTKIIDFFRCSPKKKSNIVNVRPSHSFVEKPEESVKENDELTTTSVSIPLESEPYSSHNAEYSL